MIRLRIISGDELPIYRQIVRQIIDAIAGGAIQPGERLPSHRDLSQQIVVSPLTVKRAYDDLEQEGYVITVRGQGTFIAKAPPRIGEKAKVERLRPEIQQLLNQAIIMQLSLEQLVEIVSSEYAKILQRQEEEKGKKEVDHESA